jgi:hypothetical protein
MLAAADAIVVAARWPFTQERITRSLEGVTLSGVRIGSFRQTFLPFPGCIAENVVVSRGPVPLGRIRRLSIQSSWAARIRLSHDLRRVRAEGLQLMLPAHTPPPQRRASAGASETNVREIIAGGAIVEVARGSGKPPLRFQFPELRLQNVGMQKKMEFRIAARQPLPQGRVWTAGTFGPWNAEDPGRTELSGSFKFHEADLATLDGVDGTLHAQGSFTGTLGAVQVRGHADTMEFGIKEKPNRVRLTTQYSCIVNAVTGDVVIEAVEARFLDTMLRVDGRVAGEPGKSGKTATLQFKADRARIEDLLRLFTSSPRPALSGPIVLRADVTAPPGDAPFLRRVRLNGGFRIQQARFMTLGTRDKVDKLSARARGEELDKNGADEPGTVAANLSGRALLRGGVARLSDVLFEVPGATARGGGTYDVISKQVNLKGALSLDVGLSEMTGGLKSILLKPLELFMRKNSRGGSVVPVSITGTVSRPVFKWSLTRKPGSGD